MSAKKNSRKGFTLVEGIVTGVISVILAGVLITFFIMFDRRMRENNAQMIMQMQYENVFEQIARNSRSASYVMQDGEYSSSFSGLSDMTGVSEVFMYDTAGAIIAGYSMAGDTLYEWDGEAFIPYQAGGGVVHLASAGNGFDLSADRKSISLSLRLTVQYNGSSYHLTSPRSSFKCRN